MRYEFLSAARRPMAWVRGFAGVAIAAMSVGTGPATAGVLATYPYQIEINFNCDTHGDCQSSLTVQAHRRIDLARVTCYFETNGSAEEASVSTSGNVGIDLAMDWQRSIGSGKTAYTFSGDAPLYAVAGQTFNAIATSSSSATVARGWCDYFGTLSVVS